MSSGQAPIIKTPGDIYHHGYPLNALAEIGKLLATTLPILGITDEQSRAIVGAGPFNTIEDRATRYIRDGDYNEQLIAGIFKAFGPLHAAYRIVPASLQGILAKRGYRYVIATETGEKFTVPLSSVHIDFEPRSKTETGYLFLNDDVTTTEEHIIPKGTRLTAKGPTQYGNTSPARRWEKRGKYSFSIIDGSGKEVPEDAATLIPWLAQAAQGMKKYGLDSPKRNTLEEIIGDDFGGAGKVVKLIEQLPAEDQAVILDEFNQRLLQGANIVNKDPDSLNAIAAACKILTFAAQKSIALTDPTYPVIYNYITKKIPYPAQAEIRRLLFSSADLVKSLNQLLDVCRLNVPDDLPVLVQRLVDQIVTAYSDFIPATKQSAFYLHARTILADICLPDSFYGNSFSERGARKNAVRVAKHRPTAIDKIKALDDDIRIQMYEAMHEVLQLNVASRAMISLLKLKDYFNQRLNQQEIVGSAIQGIEVITQALTDASLHPSKPLLDIQDAVETVKQAYTKVIAKSSQGYHKYVGQIMTNIQNAGYNLQEFLYAHSGSKALDELEELRPFTLPSGRRAVPLSTVALS